MISKNKRNTYIAIIALCVLGTIGVVFFLKPQTPILPDLGEPSADAPTSSNDSGVPRVFPQDTNFDLSVFSSSKFTELKESTPLTVEAGELGKEDPFKP